MLTADDHRQLAERCIRLAKACTKMGVAENLMIFAARHLELAELALRLRQPGATIERQHIRIVARE